MPARKEPERRGSAEIPQGIRPSIHNEYAPLRKVLVVPTPSVVTSFTDLVVNPVQAHSLEANPTTQTVIVRPGAAGRHALFLSTLASHGVDLVYSRATPVKEGHTPLFTRDV
ncbi:MAG: hypothetical protein KGL95_01120, partial [Patescibacteria group bacterium]|nr:hypothetical protein [Patescibacteria group bacterium]